MFFLKPMLQNIRPRLSCGDKNHKDKTKQNLFIYLAGDQPSH